jgi:hypothetical protein
LAASVALPPEILNERFEFRKMAHSCHNQQSKMPSWAIIRGFRGPVRNDFGTDAGHAQVSAAMIERTSARLLEVV